MNSLRCTFFGASTEICRARQSACARAEFRNGASTEIAVVAAGGPPSKAAEDFLHGTPPRNAGGGVPHHAVRKPILGGEYIRG